MYKGEGSSQPGVNSQPQGRDKLQRKGSHSFGSYPLRFSAEDIWSLVVKDPTPSPAKEGGERCFPEGQAVDVLSGSALSPSQDCHYSPCLLFLEQGPYDRAACRGTAEETLGTPQARAPQKVMQLTSGDFRAADQTLNLSAA